MTGIPARVEQVYFEMVKKGVAPRKAVEIGWAQWKLEQKRDRRAQADCVRARASEYESLIAKAKKRGTHE